MVGCWAEACTAAVLLLCVSRAVLSVVLGAWSVRFVGWADWVDCRCFLSFVFLGVARRLEISPCNTPSRINLTSKHTRRTYAGKRLHTPCQQVGGHLVPAHTFTLCVGEQWWLAG